MKWHKRAIPGCWLMALLFLHPFLNAQDIGAPPANLSQDANAALARLAQLSELPAPAWRYYPGDLPHGEEPALDDSGWPLAGGLTELPAGTVWLRSTIQIPQSNHGYDLTGSQVSFDLRVRAEGGIQQILYFNGRRVALGTSLEPVVMFDDVHPGDKVLVAVKLLPTSGPKRFMGSEEPLQMSRTRPNPQVIHDEAISAAFLLPAVSNNSRDSTDSMEKVEAAIKSINFAALDAGNQAGFDDSLRQTQARLTELKPLLQKANIHAAGNAHIDAAWLWPWTETVEVVRQTFGTALQLMGEYPKYTYTASAAQYYEWMQQKYPSMFASIQDRVKEGRWEIVGGMWVEPDLNMPDGESQVRQLLIGKRYFEKNFGVDVHIGWNPDSFGYNWQLPQIYKRSGVDYFLTQKMSWNDTNQLPLKLFWWQSPDGSRVLAYFPHGYSGTLAPAPLADDFAHADALNPGTFEMLYLYGVGDHGGGPTRAMLDEGDRWVEPDKAYANLNFGVAGSFFSSVEGKLDTAHSPLWDYKALAAGDTKIPEPPAGEVGLPVWNDELYFEFHRGVETTQSNDKRSMREAEEQVLNTEKWSSLAWLSGTPYPADQLNEAWKKVLFNQFHDLAAGSGIAPIYKDAEKDYQLVRLTTDRGQQYGSRCHRRLYQYPRDGTGCTGRHLQSACLAANRSRRVHRTDARGGFDHRDRRPDRQGSERRGLGRERRDEQFPRQGVGARIPSLGYEIVYARTVAAKPTVATGLKISADGMTLENQYLRVKVDAKSGCITSLVNKATQFDAIASGGCGNLLQAFKDTPKQYDAWNIDADFEDVFTNFGAQMVDSVKLVEHDSLRAVIRVSMHWQSSKFVEDITLYDGLRMRMWSGTSIGTSGMCC